MGVQRVQEGTEDAPLWGPRVEDQCGGNVHTFTTWGLTVRKSRTQLHGEEFSPRTVSFVCKCSDGMARDAVWAGNFARFDMLE